MPAAEPRLFFAFWPNADQRQALAERARRFVARFGEGRPVDPVNYHLTLRFLGATSLEQRAAVLALGQDAARRAQALSLTLDTVHAWEKPEVLVLGASRVPAALADLAGALEAGARALGYPPEHRPYRPHLTLARKVRHAPAAEAPAPFEWHATALALCESAAREGGVRYAVVAHWPLGGPGPAGSPVE